MVLYIFNMYVEELSSPLKVRLSDPDPSRARAAIGPGAGRPKLPGARKIPRQRVALRG